MISIRIIDFLFWNARPSRSYFECLLLYPKLITIGLLPPFATLGKNRFTFSISLQTANFTCILPLKLLKRGFHHTLEKLIVSWIWVDRIGQFWRFQYVLIQKICEIWRVTTKNLINENSACQLTPNSNAARKLYVSDIFVQVCRPVCTLWGKGIRL